MSDDYEVGYGKPPKKYQFKAGQPSANPKGAPKGSRRPDLLKSLNKKVQVGFIKGRRVMKPLREVLDQNLLRDALRGDRFARDLLYKRIDAAEKALAEKGLSPDQQAERRRKNAAFLKSITDDMDFIDEGKRLGIVEFVDGKRRYTAWVVEAAEARRASVLLQE